MGITKQSGSEFQYSLFGCFSDLRLCILTFCVPCYTVGKNAEHLGEDCLLTGLLYGLGLHMMAPVLRWRLRQEKNLAGSMVLDTVIGMCLPCCGLIQEAREIGWSLPESVSGKKKTEASSSETQEMNRE